MVFIIPKRNENIRKQWILQLYIQVLYWSHKEKQSRQLAVQKGENMEIQKTAMAGTLESSDAQLTVEPGENLSLTIESSVMNQ